MDKIIKRNIFDDIQKHLKEKEITILIGPRQVGKTTILQALREKLICEDGIAEQNIYYFNLDRFTDLEFFSSQENIITFLKGRQGNGLIYFFVDEAQRVKEAGRFFKGIYDLQLSVKLILTGSSSLEVKSEFIESLAGRKQIFQIYPFSFLEFVKAKNPPLLEVLESGADISSYDISTTMTLYEEFIVFGGFPRVALEPDYRRKKALLEEIHNSYIEKDIISFLQIRKPLIFKKLVGLLSFQVGNLLNVNNLCNALDVDRKTVEHYLNILEQTFIISLVPPFFNNKHKEIVKMPKVYFVDLGFRNFAIDDLVVFVKRNDHGVLLESFVASEIMKNTTVAKQKLHFWRTIHGAEVDFVIVKTAKELCPIEVKVSIKDSNVPMGLRHFIESYGPQKGFVVNMTNDTQTRFKDTSVRIINLFSWIVSFNKEKF